MQQLVAVTEGTITRGSKTYDLSVVQRGRDVFGTIREPKMDIFFKKTPKGKLELRFLNRKGNIISTKKVPYKSEDMPFLREKTLFRGNVKESNKVDLGIDVDGEPAYFFRSFGRQWKYSAYGRDKSFKGGRDISRQLLGRAKITVKQSDKASEALDIFRMGKFTLITQKYPDIKYALQPKYKPNTKRFGFAKSDEGVIPFSSFSDNPILKTRRETLFSGSLKYIYSSSRVKPMKRVLTDFLTMGKKGQVIISPLKQRVEVPTTLPKKPSSVNLMRPLSGETYTRILSNAQPARVLSLSAIKTPRSILNPITPTKTRQTTRTDNMYRIESLPATKQFSVVQPKTKSMTETRTRTETKTQTRTETRTLTPTITQTLLGKSFAKVTPKVTIKQRPPIIPPIFGKTPLSKSFKFMPKPKSKGKPSYTPTLVGMDFMKPIKATKGLAQGTFNPILPRPLAIPKRRRKRR